MYSTGWPQKWAEQRGCLKTGDPKTLQLAPPPLPTAITFMGTTATFLWLVNWLIAPGGGGGGGEEGGIWIILALPKVCLALHQEMELLGCYINFIKNQIFG